ncbi:MAG: arylsulfatase [Balneolaceae bacterium]|nr:arylsulfatase [Balneolaceae bacterium]
MQSINQSSQRVSTNFRYYLVLLAISFMGCLNIDRDDQNSDLSIKPNIVLILADDLGYGDLSILGQEKFNTPNIDQLAKDGMIFTQHYSGSTVCAPSRSSLLTGKHTGNTYIRGNKERRPEGQHPLEDEAITMAELLKNAGYITGAFGKWGLGYPGSVGDPNNQGFDKFYGYNCQRLGHHYYPYHLWDNQQKIILEGNIGSKTEVYGPEIIHSQALKFIEEHRDTTFFMYYPSIIPHAELFAPEEYMEKYRGKLEPEKAYQGVDYGEEKFRDGPYGSQPESHAAFAAMVDYLDMQVGEIVTKLKDLNLYDNTLIIFTSDNGPHREGGADPDFFNSNGDLRGYKRDLYEGGIRVPMIATWDNMINKDSRTDHISAFWDFLPTISELVGVESPRNIDGISFLPTLSGNPSNQEKHEYLYWEFHELGGRQAVRKDNWKLVRYNVLNKKKIRTELYDLSNDVGETNNIASKYPEIVQELTSIMDSARTSSSVFPFNIPEYDSK